MCQATVYLDSEEIMENVIRVEPTRSPSLICVDPVLRSAKPRELTG